MRICEHCGAEFEPKQKKSKYCSRECQVRAYSLNRPKSQGATKTCALCGKEFFTKFKQTKYCSDKCKISAYEKQQKGYAELKPKSTKKIQKVELKPRNCLHCGKEFVPTNGNQVYCSKECCVQYHRKLNQPASKEKICLRCGKKFIPIYANRKYCSDECKKKYQYKKNPIEEVKEKPKEKKISPASKRWAKMSWERLTEELLHYGIKYRDAQRMAENDTLPKDFGLKRKRCKK